MTSYTATWKPMQIPKWTTRLATFRADSKLPLGRLTLRCLFARVAPMAMIKGKTIHRSW
jgi:hypothetical protein